MSHKLLFSFNVSEIECRFNNDVIYFNGIFYKTDVDFKIIAIVV